MAKKRRRGNSWVLDWHDASGKRHVKSIGDVSEHIAEARLQQKISERLLGNEASIKDVITFRRYATLYLGWFEEEFPDSYTTKEVNVLKSLEPILGDLRLDKITLKDIKRLKVYCAKERGNAPSTINRKLADLRGMFTRAKIDGYLTPQGIQIEDVKDTESKPPKMYSEEQMNAILREDPEHAHWWAFLGNTGMRVGEFYNLRPENINTDSIHIISTSKDRTKSGQWRYVPLTRVAKNCLKDFDLSNKYLVPRPYSLDSIKQKYRRVCKRAGIDEDKRGIHCLRHTFCSYLMMSGAKPVAVQKIMGHSNIKTTMKYVHLTPNYLQDEIKNFSLGYQATPKLIDG
jgi:integrase